MLDISRIYKSNDKRSKFVKLNILVGAGVRGISILATLLLVPLTINYISSELYGIWLTLSSVIQWIGFFDIGFGNGLRNRLGESIALGDYRKGKVYVSTTYAVVLLIFTLLSFVLYFIVKEINWASFLNVSSQYNETLVTVSQILLIAFSIQMVLKLIQNVTQAFQLNALASFFDALGNVLSLGFVFLLTIFMAPDLELIAIAFSISPIIILLVASILLYLFKFMQVSPHYRYVKFSYIKDIFSLGSEFFVIQIAALVLYQMINILISRLCGPEEVTNYNVVYKYLSIALMLTNIVLAPFWSAFTDAYVKNDKKWMLSIYTKLIRLFQVALIFICIMIVMSNSVYDIWIGPSINIPISTTIIVGIYVIISVWGSIHGTIINGIGKIKFQVYYSLVLMISFLPIATLLGDNWGINGIISAMVLINIPGIFLGPYQVRRLIKGNAKGIWNK